MHLYTLLFSASFYSENTKIYLLSCTHNPNPKKHYYRIIFTLLHCYLLYRTAYHIYFNLHSHLVLDNHSVELGTQERGIVLQVAQRRTTRAFATVPREFNINPEGNFTLATTFCTWSPNLAHLLSVIKTIFWRRCRGTKESIHNG
jgi:hypothetical protein